MRNTIHKSRIGIAELIFLLLGALLLLTLGSIIARGQGQPAYREYRGIHLGMTATEVRAKLGEPALKSDEQDFFIVSPTETAQIAYNAAQKVMTISTDYTSSAPDYKTVVGEGLLQKPDGSLFRMVMFDSERVWVSYNKSAAVVPVVTITIGAMK
jgi:hypothetical protein